MKLLKYIDQREIDLAISKFQSLGNVTTKYHIYSCIFHTTRDSFIFPAKKVIFIATNKYLQWSSRSSDMLAKNLLNEILFMITCFSRRVILADFHSKNYLLRAAATALLSLSISGCGCLPLYAVWTDRSSLGDDIVSLMMKDSGYDRYRPGKWEDLTSQFFSSYIDEQEVMKYFNSIGGTCWSKAITDGYACRVTRELSWYTQKTICSEPKFQRIDSFPYIYHFKMMNNKVVCTNIHTELINNPIKQFDW